MLNCTAKNYLAPNHNFIHTSFRRVEHTVHVYLSSKHPIAFITLIPERQNRNQIIIFITYSPSPLGLESILGHSCDILFYIIPIPFSPR